MKYTIEEKLLRFDDIGLFLYFDDYVEEDDTIIFFTKFGEYFLEIYPNNNWILWVESIALIGNIDNQIIINPFLSLHLHSYN